MIIIFCIFIQHASIDGTKQHCVQFLFKILSQWQIQIKRFEHGYEQAMQMAMLVNTGITWPNSVHYVYEIF